jgi:hypothetical protein
MYSEFLNSQRQQTRIALQRGNQVWKNCWRERKKRKAVDAHARVVVYSTQLHKHMHVGWRPRHQPPDCNAAYVYE